MKVEPPSTFHPSNLLPSDLQLLWVGGTGGMEADLVTREGIPFETVDAAGLHGVGLKAMPGNMLRLGRGFLQAQRILKQFRPEALFFTGGYVAAPLAVAARSRSGGRMPILMYVPDIEPGLALKGLARFADRIALTAAASRAYFPGKPEEALRVTGYPLRPGLKSWSLEQARQALDLEPDLPCLLVMGGSKGARGINQALFEILPDLLADVQVVHLSGKPDWAEVEAVRGQLPWEVARRYHPYAYLHTDQIGAAFTAADLVVSRAGASTLGELPLFGLPAVLVPYPHAWRYQQVNAEYLAEAGAAIVIQEHELSEHLLTLLRKLMQDAPRLGAMRRGMAGLARPEAAESIAGLLVEMAASNRVGAGSA